VEVVNSDPKPSRKELERHRRKADILIAARELFINKGFASATLEEVAQAAEFSKGTIYNYFANKEDLLWGLIEQFLEESVEVARREFQKSDVSPRDKFSAYARAVLSSGPEHEFFHMLMREGHILEASDCRERMQILTAKIGIIWEIIAEVIAAEIQSGNFRQGNPLQMARLFDLMVRSFGFGGLKKEYPIAGPSSEESVDLIVGTFFDGVALHTEKDQ